MCNKTLPGTDEPNYIRFLKYLFVGGSAALLDFCVFIAALSIIEKMCSGFTSIIFDLQPTATANTLGILSGFLWSFLLNKYWAFSAGGNSKIQFLLVCLLVFFNIIATSYLITVLQYNLNTPPERAKILMQIVVVGWNYLIYHHLIFKKK